MKFTVSECLRSNKINQVDGQHGWPDKLMMNDQPKLDFDVWLSDYLRKQPKWCSQTQMINSPISSGSPTASVGTTCKSFPELYVRNLMPWYKSKEKTHVFHGCQDYRWTPGRIGAVPPRCDRCCICEWCRGIRFGQQKELSPSPHIHGAGSQMPRSTKPLAPEAAPQSRWESCLTAWSQTAPQTEHHFFSSLSFSILLSPFASSLWTSSHSRLEEQVRTAPPFSLFLPLSLFWFPHPYHLCVFTQLALLEKWELTSHMTPQLLFYAPHTPNLPLLCFSGSAMTCG